MLAALYDRAISCFNRLAPDKAKTVDDTSSTALGGGMPDGKQVESAFLAFVVELDLSPEKQKTLLELDLEKKWLMLLEQKTLQGKLEIVESCEQFVSFLVSLEQNVFTETTVWSNVFAQLEALTISLRTQSHSYVEKFLRLGGLRSLVQLLLECRKQSGHERFAALLLGSFRALLIATHGRTAVLQSADSLMALAACLDFRDAKCKILSGLCLVPEDGHRAVLRALTDARFLLGERARFQTLIDDLHRSYRSDKETTRVRTAIMSLINALLKSGPCEASLEFRLHLRYEFLMLGVQEVIDRLRSENEENPVLQDHFDLFEMMRQEDEQEAASSAGDSGSSSPIDFESPAGMAEVLSHRLGNSVALPHFISLLQHLLMIPGDEKHVYLWRLFDIVLQQLSLQSTMDGMTADVYEPVTHVNMDEVISRLQTQHNYEQLENSYRRTVEELQTERTRVIELENKISDLQDNRSFISFSRQSESSPSDPCPSPSPSLPPVCPPAVPPPPPPPSSGQLKATGILPNNEPMKKVPKPNGTLKTLNWTVIPRERIPGTLWENIDEEKLYKQLDLVELATNFAAGKGQGGEDTTESLAGTLQRRFRNETSISVIESRRAQNCTIMLSKLKLTNKEIRQAVLSMDEKSKLPKDMLEQMLKFVPTKEEMSQLNETVAKFKTPAVLAIADRFLFEVGQIPRYEQRLRCLNMMRNRFRERLDDLIPSIQGVIRASQAVSSNKRLKQLLALVLAIGNYLNFGKRIGNAQGITLGSLNALSDVRNSLRYDRTLLHFVIQMIDNKFPDIMRLKRELHCVYEAARYSRQELVTELKALEQAISSMWKELHTPETTDKRDEDKFVPVVTAFLSHASTEFKDAEKLFDDMLRQFGNCVRHFGGDPLTSSPDEFFGVFSKFLNSFTEAHHQIWQEREELERVKRQTIARSIFAKKVKRREKADDFEQLISALQSGELFSEELTRLRSSIRAPTRKKRDQQQSPLKATTTIVVR